MVFTKIHLQAHGNLLFDLEGFHIQRLLIELVVWSIESYKDSPIHVNSILKVTKIWSLDTMVLSCFRILWLLLKDECLLVMLVLVLMHAEHPWVDETQDDQVLGDYHSHITLLKFNPQWMACGHVNTLHIFLKDTLTSHHLQTQTQTQTKGHFTHEPRAVTLKLWELKRKCPKAVPRYLQNHVVWSRILKCSVKSCVTGPSIKCYFNEFLFMQVFTYDKIE